MATFKIECNKCYDITTCTDDSLIEPPEHCPRCGETDVHVVEKAEEETLDDEEE